MMDNLKLVAQKVESYKHKLILEYQLPLHIMEQVEIAVRERLNITTVEGVQVPIGEMKIEIKNPVITVSY